MPIERTPQPNARELQPGAGALQPGAGALQPTEGTGHFRLPDSPRAILLVRLTARGDVLLASPVVEALRRRYPQAHIAWAVESHARSMIEHHEDLDEIIVWDRAGWKAMIRAGRWRELRRAFRELRRRLRAPGFDVALDLQGLLRSGWVAWLSGAPLRIGLGSKEGSRVLMTGTVPRYGTGPGSTSLQYPYFAGALGLPNDASSLHLALSDAEERFVQRFVAESGLSSGYAALAPFTTRPQKHWFEDRWGALAARICHQLGLPVVILGGPADRDAAGRIARLAAECIHGRAAVQTGDGNAGVRSQAAVIDLTGRTRLGEAAAVVKHARLFVGVDTCLTHVSVAFRRPSVLLFGSNIPYRGAPHERARIALELQPCAPCGNHPTCGGEFRCMRALGIDEVFALARSAFREG